MARLTMRNISPIESGNASLKTVFLNECIAIKTPPLGNYFLEFSLNNESFL
jgi:hypothetical protein